MGALHILFIVLALRARRTVWLLPSVAKTTTARRGCPTPRRTLDASPMADAVVLTMNGKRYRRMAHGLIRKGNAAARDRRCLHLVCMLAVVVIVRSLAS